MRGLVVVVNYNQAPEIGNFLPLLAEKWPKEQTVVIDDGSTDDSPSIADKLGFVVSRTDRNRGVGSAIRRGIHHAKDNGYDYVVIMSSNGKMKPAELSVVTGPVERGEADYVQGSRFFARGGSIGLSRFRRVAIPAFSILSSGVLGRSFSDITCGFRAYTVAFATDPRMDIDQEWLDRYELEYYLHYYAVKLGYRIVEVPVTIDYSHLETGRKSKIRPLVDWWSMVRPFVLLASRMRR